MRSISAKSVTASETSASFSARVASPRKMGRSESVPDDVAKHPHAVLVSPLEIVDEQRYGLRFGERTDGHGGEIEHAQELLIRG